MAREANEDPTAAADATELVAVRAALSAHASALPQNMFTPFAIHHPQATFTHWANVDTGSMVNIIYEGIVEAFPYLQQYRQPFQHVVVGVGG